MKKCSFVLRAAIPCLFLILFLTGCLSVSSTPDSRFYTLRAVEGTNAAEKSGFPSDQIIGVGPFRIPEYQNRPQMVTLNKDKTLNFAQFDRWGESLDLALARVVFEDLSLILPQATLKMFPWNLAIPVKYQVIMDIVQLESRLDKDMFLAVQWSVIDLKNKKLALIRNSEIREPIKPHNYLGMADALSRACATLSSSIAEGLVSLTDSKQ